ncbi:centrosomal protein of 135 kDa-like isoform X1 [Acanthaster planci]|uniref:Centrosomal protein of 135 kDa-like isoform X1 n=1 Tax=Acanthaster planci TaxID=133434 RepID=A0A8B7Z2K1_ACAPL|nr:centrosomal protein of 135 kDa-like isoform X1 [Acanthaster planci]
MATLAEQRFTALRKRLDQLGYRQALGIESLPLVEKLFNDLVHTTSSLKNAKLQASRATDEKTPVCTDEAYRSDNAKLVRENNDLHLQLIKLKEESEATIKDLKAAVRKLEHENADLRFLNSQFVHKVRALEKEAKAKGDRISQLQEKNFQAVVQTPGGRKRHIPFRRQRMDIDSTVPEDGPRPSLQAERQVAGFSPADPYIADLVKIADNRAETLQQEVERLREKEERNEKTIRRLTKQVETRDNEMNRLSRQLEGGRPFDVVSTEAKNRSNERLISHLNVQESPTCTCNRNPHTSDCICACVPINLHLHLPRKNGQWQCTCNCLTKIDYLQQANRDAERRLREASIARDNADQKALELSRKNEELAEELRSVDRLAHRLKADKDSVIRAADQDVIEAKVELQETSREVEVLDRELEQLKQDNKSLVADIDQVNLELSLQKQETERVQDLLVRVQDDKRWLSDKVNRLTSNERELVLELERIRNKAGGKAKTKSPTKMDTYLKSLEEERNYYKGEVDVLNKVLKGQHLSLSVSRDRSPTRSGRGTSPSRTPSKMDKKSASHYEAIIRVLEDERDFYKREYDTLRVIRSSSSPKKSSMSPAARDRSVAEDTEIIKLRRERDELQSLLDKFERHLAEIQANVKVLTNERDKTNILYEQANSELQRLRREAVKSPKTSRASVAAQSILQRVELERDEALADLRRMVTERDSLRERLKISTDTHLNEKARLEQKVEDLEKAVEHAEQDRSSLQSRVQSFQAMISTLEEQVRSQALRIEEAYEESSQHKATSTQMRLLAEQAETSLGDHQRRLNQRSGELQAADERNARQEERITDLTITNNALHDEVRQLRGTISSLDREKDTLQNAVDDKTEKIAALEQELLGRGRTLSDTRATLEDLQDRLERANDELGTKDREVRSLRRQLDSSRDELTETVRGRDATMRENRRLQEDLATMTRENQAVNIELEEAIEERESLKEQVQEYIAEVARIEDLLAAKERENRDLLENYRSATSEAQRWETEASQRSGETSTFKVELMTKDAEMKRLRDKITLQERDIQQHISAVQAYELQVSSLTRSIANLEDSVRQLQDEKESLVQDLSAVRDLCVKLENTKEAMSRQLTTRNIDTEQLESTVEDQRHEIEMLRNQVVTERASVRNLETLLSNNREKEFQAQLDSQEQRSELQLVKDRLALADSKVQSQSREIQTLRSRAAQLEADLEKVRRQLTSERFDKERISQELRRSTLSPSTVENASYTRTSLTNHTTSRRSTSPPRSSSPTLRSLSPSKSGRRSPDRSILKSSPAYRSSSPERR